ncbi:MAG: PcfJ domain-containing protein [Eubacterium sp.]|nr:PcfJ domain-containing protein [Eubacterium sp.]
MRKRECLKSEPCEVPAVNVLKKEPWNGGTIGVIAKCQLIVSGDRPVLNVDLFRDGFLIVRYFADRASGYHAAWIVRIDEWRKLNIQNAVNVACNRSPNYREYYPYADYVYWDYETAEDKKVQRDYFGTELQYWESDLQRERRIRQLNNKQDRITYMMEKEIEEIPEDFCRWVSNSVFDRNYLFQRKGRMVRCICTACGSGWNKKKAYGIGKKTCPKCGAEVTGTYKDQETAGQRAVYLLQKAGDRWVERVFNAVCTWFRGNPKQIDLEETIRIFIPKGKTWGECFYYVTVARDGTSLWWDTNKRSWRMKAGYLYPGNLQEVSEYWPERLKHCGMDVLAAHAVKFNVNNMIIHWHAVPWLEYVIKGGFCRIAQETIGERWWVKAGMVNSSGRNPQDAFRLDEGRVNRLRQMDGGHTVLGWLQYEKATGTKISQKNLVELDRRGIRCDESDVWKLLSYVRKPDVFANYIRKQAKLSKMSYRDVINTWVDYLDMAKNQKLNLAHEIFYKPKNLAAAHDECVRAGQKKEMMERAAVILGKFPDVEKIMDSVREKYSYRGKDYSIVVPENVIDIIHEGRALGHCIDTTDRYFDRIQHRITYLVFLRRTDVIDLPFYTLEIEPGGTVRQQRTTGNRQNKTDVKDYMPFIREWQETVWQRITEEDQRLAAESRATRIREYRELREKKEKVWHGALAGQLLADVLESDLLEAVT